MAHFARVIDGVVFDVMVIDNKDCGGGDFPDSEPMGQAFIAEQGFGEGWVQTSYTGSFRVRLAVNGGFYDSEHEAFYPAAPGADWVLDQETWQWVSPNGVKLPFN